MSDRVLDNQKGEKVTQDSQEGAGMGGPDIIDRIDALVDAQLQQEPSGYDHNINQPRCWHCNRDYHGLRITTRIERMRRYGVMDPDYRYADDDSDTICPGPDFIGPWATPTLLRHMKRGESRESLLSNLAVGDVVRFSSSNGWTQIGTIDSVDSSPLLGEAAVSIRPHMAAFSESITAAMESISATFSGIASALDLEPDTRTPQQRALPRPSTTPPMWSVNPGRQRRRS